MNKKYSSRQTGSLVTVISAAAMSGVLLAGCVTDDEYARQLCLDKGIVENGQGYSDCITAQRAWIEEDRRHNVRFRPND